MSGAGQVIGYEETVHLRIQMKCLKKGSVGTHHRKLVISNEKTSGFLGTPHWGLNLDPDKYAGDEREQLFFSAGNYATDCSLLNL